MGQNYRQVLAHATAGYERVVGSSPRLFAEIPAMLARLAPYCNNCNLVIELLVRFLKRIAILVPGIVVTYLAARSLFPILDERIPASLAVFVLYVLIAYILIPAAIRVLNLIIQPKHIPLYSTTPDGLACDPVNVGVIATRAELIELMRAAGWHQADKRTLRSVVRFASSLLLNQPYPGAPFSKLYLFGRSQDMGFQLAVGNSPRHRHHIRFWGVVDTEDHEYRQHVFFWKRYHRSPRPGKVLWVGAASLDLGIGIIRHNAQMTHRIHHDTDAERTFVVKQLKATKLIKRTRTVTVGAPYQLRNRVISGYMLADGKMTI